MMTTFTGDVMWECSHLFFCKLFTGRVLMVFGLPRRSSKEGTSGVEAAFGPLKAARKTPEQPEAR